MSILEAQGLSKTYGNGETAVHALQNVSLRVKRGEFVAITGPSGCGKSTLLHMLGAVDRPTGGRVLLEGVDLTARSETELAIIRRRKIGLIFQFYNLVPVLTAEENIALPLQLDHQPVDRAYLDDILQTLDIADRRRHLPNQLSGGQQQRVAVGRALIHQPAILLADEPTGNLDTRNSREIMALLRSSVRKYGQTLVVVTHDPAIAAQADRTVYMEDGQVKAGEPQ